MQKLLHRPRRPQEKSALAVYPPGPALPRDVAADQVVALAQGLLRKIHYAASPLRHARTRSSEALEPQDQGKAPVPCL